MNREDLKSIKFIIEKGEKNSSSDFESGAKTNVVGKELKEILKSELTNSILKKISFNNKVSQLSSEIKLMKSVIDSIENTEYELNTDFATKLGL